MGEVREENGRLKMMLEQIEKDYHSLQLRFFDIVKQEAAPKKLTESAPSHEETHEEPHELVSLCLGRRPSDPKKDDNGCSNPKNGKAMKDEDWKASLSLGWDSKFQLSTELVSDQLAVEAGDTWPTSKLPKTMRNGDDEVSQQTQVKRARVSVRARCDTPTVSTLIHVVFLSFSYVA